MGSVAARFTKLWRFPGISRPVSSFEVGIQGSSKLCYSTVSDVEATEKDGKNNNEAQDDDFFVAEIPELQSVDPRRGRRFRGVHKEKNKTNKGLLIHYLSWRVVGEVESSFSLGALSSFGNYMEDWISKLVGTLSNGGMFDQRIEGARDLPRPAQWHRIAVHNEHLGAYAVQQLVKNSPVYVEGDIETRVFNDSINGETKNIPEICVRYDGKLHLVKTGESISSINFEELREGLL